MAPAFVHRRGLFIGPQKLGKNPLLAAQCTLEGVGPSLFAGWAGRNDGYSCADEGCACGWEYPYARGEPMGMVRPTALIQITAFSQDATDNTYGALRPMIEDGPLSSVIRNRGAGVHAPAARRQDRDSQLERAVTVGNRSRSSCRTESSASDDDQRHATWPTRGTAARRHVGPRLAACRTRTTRRATASPRRCSSRRRAPTSP
jgi:hypothetical protein